MKSASITVKLPEPVKTRLDRLAKATHRSRSSLVSSAVEEMLSVEEWQIQGVKEALREADSGHMTAHEEIKQEWETRLYHTSRMWPDQL
ncbi:MAG: CopG family transcriptional [Geobacteraceae bacterium]|nr:MAG: CopG family transcriptional [Geobacteraceae bacterium]